ncbi:MAG: NAD(P)/FAD-dependent oxidoreductase [Acaryochloridaceae cyanobacterium RL_2_7]|nr:NAD(P)/FAD-dependent oxidoreductase [Acaryochloridaceae cyanobacterium RL_2_7]
MLYDYDLVVIGDSLSGRWAAISAAKQHARTAWIQQTPNDTLGFSQTYQHLCNLWSHHLWLTHQPPFESLQSLRAWIEEVRRNLLQAYQLKYLSEAGVDVIQAMGHFLPYQKHQRAVPIFAVKERQLQSRRYLLALEADRTEPVTSDLFFLANRAETKPEHISIVSQSPESIFSAQVLRALGYKVSFIKDAQLLPYEDPDLSFFLQNQLEAQGIEIHSSSSSSGRTFGDMRQAMVLKEPYQGVKNIWRRRAESTNE